MTTPLTPARLAPLLPLALLLALCALLSAAPARAQSGNGAAFVSQSVPATMTPGQSYPVAVTVQNTGTATWTSAAAYSLGSQSPQDNGTWGTGRVSLPNSVSPGQSATFSFTVTAPAAPGQYAFQWRMVQDGVEWFGDFTPSTSANVAVPGALSNGSAFVSQSVPSAMTAGQPYPVSVTLTNTGTTPWTGAAAYSLGSQSPQDGQTWGQGRVALPGPVAPGQSVTFSFNVTAPSTPGSYPFQWRMVQDGVEWFGDFTPSTSVNVTAPPTQAPGNIAVTGHDDDLHETFQGDVGTDKAHAAAIVGFARRGAPDPTRKVLIFDHGSEYGAECGQLMSDLGVPYDLVDPDAGVPDPSLFDVGRYSAIGVASNVDAGGTDNTAASSANLLAAKASFQSFSAAGGGLFAFAGVDDPNYYGFLPRPVSSTFLDQVTGGFTQTALGASLGVPAVNDNPTHNYFAPPGTSGEDAGWRAVEAYGSTGPETLFYLGAGGPPAPLGLTALSGNTQVSLAWNPVPGATAYALSRAATSAGPFLPVASGIPGTAWVDPNLVNGQTYFYVVSAANGFGAGPNSNVASATPDGALPAPANAAAFVSQIVPASMSAGQSYPVTVTMRNTGTSVWTAAGGYRLGSQAWQDNTTWTGSNRVALPGPVQPGATAAFTFNVTAPATPGVYDFRWRMVQELVEWFGDFTPDVAVSVGPPPFQIANVNNGDVLSGDVVLNVVASSNLDSDEVTLYLDGQSIEADNIQQQPDGSYAASLTVYTNDYPNGAHQITVSDGQGNNQTRQVTFGNTIENLSCGAIFDLTPGETDVPRNSHITADLTSSLPWQVDIQDYDGNTVNSYSGTGSRIDVAWDGTDSSGNVVDDDSYTAVLTADTSAGSGAVHPQAADGGKTIKRPIGKDSIGDTLIVIDVDAMTPYSVPSKLAVAQSYAKFIKSELNSKVGTDFNRKPSPMLITGPEVNADANLRNRILNKYKVALNLVYIFAHGETHLGGGIFEIPTAPLFQLGNYLYFSQLPAHYQPTKNDIDVGKIISDAQLGYGDTDTPPSLVWMDNCQSAGFNPVIHDWTWASDFGIDKAEENGYSQGVFLGWSTGGFGRNDAVPYGWPLGTTYYNWSVWRVRLWDHLFNGGKNFITSLNQVNSITPKNGQIDPQGLYQYTGIDSTAF